MTINPSEEQLKELIIEKAARHSFDQNPLLNTSHTITCNRCNHNLKIVYLDFLKSGRFRIGKSLPMESENLLGIFISIEEEKVTPIILEFICENCGNIIEVTPLTVEYLDIIISMKDPSKIMYS